MTMTRAEHKAEAENSIKQLGDLGLRFSALLDTETVVRADADLIIQSLGVVAQRAQLHIACAAVRDWDVL